MIDSLPTFSEALAARFATEPDLEQTPGLVQSVQRDIDIQTLKLARQKVIELRTVVDRYSHELSYEFAAPARKVDEQLAWLLLRRELQGEDEA